MGRLGAWLGAKVRDPLLGQLRQGATPDGLSASVATGAALAVFPLLGATTALCALAGRAFRLNHVALQLTNYLLYPVQLLLIVPFVRLGEWLARAEPMPLDPVSMPAEFAAAPGAFLAKFAWAGVHGVVAWALVAPACGWLLHRALRPAFHRLSELSNRT